MSQRELERQSEREREKNTSREKFVFQSERTGEKLSFSHRALALEAKLHVNLKYAVCIYIKNGIWV